MDTTRRNQEHNNKRDQQVDASCDPDLCHDGIFTDSDK